MIVTEAIGWVSSLILIATVARQIRKQYREGSSEGVSTWLFAGQLAASVGFTVYSALVKNWVFVVTNSVMLVNAVVGFGLTLHQRRKESSASGSAR